MNITVIIPAYNEINTIEEILRRVQKMEIANEILVVDDGSIDGTRAFLQEINGKNNVRVILHENNQGKGAAVVTGIKNATGDVVLIQDADLEYDPRDYPALY
jgi:glycosyltransferase involved in cell wall biosynthesis